MSDSATDSSVGIVEKKELKLDLPEGGLQLEEGGALLEITVAYECCGTLSPKRDNVVLICHALTGDAHVAGRYDASDERPGWWDQMVGPGKGIDTNRFFVICSNILGGCSGTTGPSSTNPETGKPYGSRFPKVTVGDFVEVQHRLLQQLGYGGIFAAVGGSLGGMQVLEWGVRFPEYVANCVCIASGASLSTQALAFDVVGREAITSDPDWKGGDYAEAGTRPENGLAQARRIGHITYLSPEKMSEKFGREKKSELEADSHFATLFEVESYLRYQGRKFVQRFDANSYLHITYAMDAFDLSETHGTLSTAMEKVQARFLIVALSEDWLFTPEQSEEIAKELVSLGKRVSYCRLVAPHGHDAFLVDIEHLSEILSTFLAGASLHPETDVPVGTVRARADHEIVASLIEPGASVLDLGCGRGDLMALLNPDGHPRTLGVDIDLSNVMSVIGKGLNVLQGDIDTELSLIADNSFDYVIMNETMQVVPRPRFALRQVLRVGRYGIISFPNFAAWPNRLQLGMTGRMPRSSTLPFEWYDTPNIHLTSLKDFIELCKADGIKVLDVVCIPEKGLGRLMLAMGCRNLGAGRIFVKITRE